MVAVNYDTARSVVACEKKQAQLGCGNLFELWVDFMSWGNILLFYIIGKREGNNGF
jgi:hypothetical protein